MAKPGAAEAAVRAAKNNTAVQAAARIGFAVSGLLQLAIGVIAFEVAFHRSRGEADQSGALHDLADMPGGPLLLGVCILGFLALGLWLGLSAILPRPHAGTRLRVLHLADAAKAIVYLTLASTAVTVLIRGEDRSAASTADFSAALLRLPAGAALLGLLGLAVIGVAGYLVYKGTTRRFERDIRLRPDFTERPVVALGVIGYVARGVALGGVGVLIVLGALTSNPARSNGLDAALRAAAELPFGQIILSVIGVGWLASGVYGFVRAARARMR